MCASSPPPIASLDEMVKNGSFREGLLLPHQRDFGAPAGPSERGEDIPILAEQFVRQLSGWAVREAIGADRAVADGLAGGQRPQLERDGSGVALRKPIIELTVEPAARALARARPGRPRGGVSCAIQRLLVSTSRLTCSRSNGCIWAGHEQAGENVQVRLPICRHHLPTIPLPGQKLPAEVAAREASAVAAKLFAVSRAHRGAVHALFTRLIDTKISDLPPLF